ncbi:hypothetical protein BJ322DRAFT_1103869 [Thelephora terrestris]|uniref:Uncharacterized protein n=1 Tax=Thelephora terrestris TaxID=56493 RepID=A0A9P6HUI4_9AGAM|nr:hypothetical protein BJ322DRAFT_1103869 [Thelephora terrestris]
MPLTMGLTIMRLFFRVLNWVPSRPLSSTAARHDMVNSTPRPRDASPTSSLKLYPYPEMDHSEMLSSDPKRLKYTLGYHPIQCHLCGREFTNMGCKICSPYTPPIQKNRGGFSKYGQLTVGSQSWPASPKKKASKSGPPETTWKVRYEQVDGGSLKLITVGPGTVAPPIKNGQKKPFFSRTEEGGPFTVRAKITWLSHEWECDIPCNRDLTEAALFLRICIYFQQFLEAMAKEKCSDSRFCLCGGRSISVTREDIVILGYDVSATDETFTMVVYACRDV